MFPLSSLLFTLFLPYILIRLFLKQSLYGAYKSTFISSPQEWLMNKINNSYSSISLRYALRRKWNKPSLIYISKKWLKSLRTKKRTIMNWSSNYILWACPSIMNGNLRSPFWINWFFFFLCYSILNIILLNISWIP